MKDIVKLVFLFTTFVLIGAMLCSTASASSITNDGVKKLVDIQCEASPNFSPDGNRIVFSTADYNTDSNQDSIWILNLTTGEKNKVNIPDSKWLYYVDWHPNGNKIIFQDSDRNTAGTSDLYTINIDGTAKTCLTKDQSYEVGDAHYSPDGEKIVYTVQYSSTLSDIWLMDADGSNKTRLTNDNLDTAYPRFSSDGKKIVYKSGVDPNGNIWIMDSDGGNKKQITFDNVLEGAPAWSPDGKYIAYQKSPGVNQPRNIWVMKADGSEQTQLTNYSKDGIDGGTPNWSQDGDKIVFCSGGMNSNPMNTNWDIYEMTLFRVFEVSDGLIVETPKVKYYLSNGGFAKELWVDHNGDGVYDENIGFNDTSGSVNWAGFGSWYITTVNNNLGHPFVSEGSIFGSDYSYNIVETSDKKIVLDFTSTFSGTTGKVRWEIYPNGDAKVTPWTESALQNTYNLAFTWYVTPNKNDMVGMRLSPDNELTSTVTFTDHTEIANPWTENFIQRKNADFSDISYSHPYQFYKDSSDDYTLLLVEPKVSKEQDWESTECSQANDAIFGGRQDNRDSGWALYKKAGLVDWMWYYDWSDEDGNAVGPLESPTTQPINQDKKFSFYVHWMWGDTSEAQRSEDAGKIAEKLSNTAGSSSSVYLRDSKGSPLSGAVVQYYNGSWKTFGSGITDVEGKAVADLKAGIYTFRVTYMNTSADITQNTSQNPTVNFQTSLIQARLLNSSGNVIDTNSAVVKYYSGGWYDCGTTTGGIVSKELFAGNSQTFRMTYQNVSKDITQNTSQNPTVNFQTSLIQARLLNSSGNVVDTNSAVVKYYSGGWYDCGTTTGGIVSKELFAGNSQTFRMTYQYVSKDIIQNTSQNPTVDFQTSLVQARLLDNTGVLMDVDDSTVQYYSGGWYNFGTTTDGKVEKELFPVNYTFRMNYKYTSQDIAKPIRGLHELVEFKTGKVVSTTCTYYYAGVWRPFTNPMYMLPGNYTFRFNDGTPDKNFAITEGDEKHIP